MVFYDKTSYGDFLASEEKIATNILADRLSTLEHYGFITKKVSAEKKNKFIFSMTEKGIELVPILMELTIWGSKHNPPGDETLLKALAKDKEAMTVKFQEKLRAAATEVS